MEPIVGLIRQFAVGFFNGQRPEVCREIMAPNYRLRIGHAVIEGRDERYLPAVQSQFEQFPGLTMTVHQVVASGSRAALSFTEHGLSGDRVAAWAGIALYESDGSSLTGCVAVEDYHARRRQLTGGAPDPIAAPANAPWDTAALHPNPEAEAVVQAWLATPSPYAHPGVSCDDEHLTGDPPLNFEVVDTEITDLFSAGADVAFHARHRGRYRGGFAGLDSSPDGVVLYAAGIVSVADDRVDSGRVVRDRAALHRCLRALS